MLNLIFLDLRLAKEDTLSTSQSHQRTHHSLLRRAPCISDRMEKPVLSCVLLYVFIATFTPTFRHIYAPEISAGSPRSRREICSCLRLYSPSNRDTNLPVLCCSFPKPWSNLGRCPGFSGGKLLSALRWISQGL